MVQNTDLTARQAVISEIQGQYSSGKLETRDIPSAIKEASAIWQEKENTTETTDDIPTKIGKTLAKYVEYLNSDDSPFSQSEKENGDISGLIEAIQPDGLLHNDLRDAKFDSRDLRESFMKQFTGFMEKVAEKSASGYQEEVKTALSIFPPQDIIEYNCVGGAKSRILEAERQLDSPQSMALTEGYTQARLNCNIESRNSVKVGNQVHINPAIDYLMGVAPSAISEVDPSYITPVSQMSASVLWDSYKSTTGLSNQIKDTIISESKNAIADNNPDNNILISQESQKQYFDAWKINVSDVYENFIDDKDYTTKRLPKAGGRLENNDELNERLGKEVAKAMSDSLNKYIFGADKKDSHVDWLEAAEEKTNIPDVKKLSTKDGSQWVLDQLQACKPESGIENIGQEAALMSLLIFSEKVKDKKPAYAIKVLHELGGRGEEGINKGLEELNSITSNNANYSEISSKINGQCTALCQRGHNDGGIKEYADYLKNSDEKPELLLHTMIAGGASDEEIGGVIDILSADELSKKDHLGRTPAYFAGKYLNSNALDLLKKKKANCSMVDNNGETPMHIAILNSNVELIQKLHDLNPDLLAEKNQSGETPMHFAALYGKVEVIQKIYDLNRKLLTKKDAKGKTPMHYAISSSNVEAIQKIGDMNPNLLAMRDANGLTPMHYAAALGNVEAIKKLHDMNSNLLAKKDAKGRTPLHIAAKYGKIDTVKFLIEASKKDNQVDTDYLNSRSLFQRRTALSKAVSKGHTNVVEELLKAGASKGPKDWRGRAADKHAIRGNRGAEEKYQAIAALLNNPPNGGQDGGIGR